MADLEKRPDARGFFVSQDNDFDLKRANLPLAAGTLTVVKSLDELNKWITDQLDTRIRADLAAQETELRSIVSSQIHVFAEFLTANLVLSSADIGVVGVIRNVDGFEIKDVGDVHFNQSPDSPEPDGLSVDLHLDVAVTYNATVPPPDRQFKIGSELPQPPMSLEHAMGFPTALPATAQRELTVTVDAELRGSARDRKLEPKSVRIKRSFASGLLALVSDKSMH